MPKWPLIEDSRAIFNISLWYTFGTTIWCATDHCSDASDIWWPPLLHKHTIFDIIANRGGKSGSFSCFEINLHFESDTSGPSIVS